MAQVIGPGCGAEYFLTFKRGTKTIFKVASEREVQLFYVNQRIK